MNLFSIIGKLPPLSTIVFQKWQGYDKSLANNRDIINSIVLKFHYHPNIKSKFTKIAKFFYHKVTLVHIRKTMKDLLDKTNYWPVSVLPVGKYWSPGRPEDVPLQRPQLVP